MSVENISKSRLGRFALLKNKKHRLSEGLFIVEGEKCVSDLAGSFEPVALVAAKDWFGSTRSDYVAQLFPEVYAATARDMERLSSLSTPPPVLSVMRMPGHSIAAAPPADRLSLALDGIRDPGNLGTIIRTADWFGIRTIYASTDTADVFNSKTIQSTMGSLGRIEVVYTRLPELFAANPSLPVYGTLLDGEDIYEADLSRNGFIVMGNEGTGLSDEVRRCVDHRLLVPCFAKGNEHAESLNVAIATGIILSEFMRR